MSENFAKNLRVYRELAHMTQTDLAHAAGTTRSTVNNYERGRADPSIELLCRFADVLGVDILTLVSETEEYPDMMRKVLVTDEEAALIDAYRKAYPTYQVVAMDILKQHPKEA